MSDLFEIAQSICTLANQVDPDDSTAIASIMCRTAAHLWCRLGNSEDFVRMAIKHARLEHSFHGTVPDGGAAMNLHAQRWREAQMPLDLDDYLPIVIAPHGDHHAQGTP